MPTSTSAPSTEGSAPAKASRTVRAMLARGAACDLCRSRKVKCDGVRPICSQCLKSAKGKSENCNCIYEGGGTVAKGAPPAPKRVRSAGEGTSPPEKRPRESDGLEEETTRKKGPSGGARVETLVDRITELERRLLLQAQSLTSTDSVSAPSSYPSAAAPAPPPAFSSYPSASAATAPSAYSAPQSAWPPVDLAHITAHGSQNFGGQPAQAAAAAQAGPTFNNGSYSPLNYPPYPPQNITDFFVSPSSGLQSASPIDFTSTDFSNTGSAPSSAHPNGSSGYHTSPSAGGHSLAASPADSLGLDAQFLQILYPAWPTSLPSPSIVNHMVRTFLARATIPASIFNKPRLLSSLDLPPSSPGFPETALLHAICAYTADYVSQDELNVRDERGRTYWEGAVGPKEYHFACAKKGLEKGTLAGSNTFQILQATIICCYVAYHAADFTDLWLLSGQATRLCTPLGLNHLPAYDYDAQSAAQRCEWSTRVRMTPAAITNSLLPPCTTQAEHYERNATFWAAFAIDRHGSAATEWSTSIDEQDISTHLPCWSTVSMPELAYDFDLGRIPALSINDESFLKQSKVPTGSMGLYIKGTVLLGRVVNYVQRLPRNLRLPDNASCAQRKAEMKQDKKFTDLDYALSMFRTTVSSGFVDAGNRVDGYIASSFALPHVANILLHEIFVDRHDRSACSSLEKCLTSAKIIVNSTYILFQISNDLLGMDPFLAFTWSVVGRALVRDLAVRRFWGNKEGEAAARRLAEDCLGFTKACNRSAEGIVKSQVKTLQALLNNPDLLLPADSMDDPVVFADPRRQLWEDELLV